MLLTGGEMIIKKYMIILSLSCLRYPMKRFMMSSAIQKLNMSKYITIKMLFSGLSAERITRRQIGGPGLPTPI